MLGIDSENINGLNDFVFHLDCIIILFNNLKLKKSMFTLKELFPRLIVKARFKAGKRVAQAWKTLTKTEPKKVIEDNISVCQYPDSFKLRATKIVKRSIRQGKKIIKPEVRKKRKRIPRKI